MKSGFLVLCLNKCIPRYKPTEPPTRATSKRRLSGILYLPNLAKTLSYQIIKKAAKLTAMIYIIIYIYWSISQPVSSA